MWGAKANNGINVSSELESLHPGIQGLMITLMEDGLSDSLLFFFFVIFGPAHKKPEFATECTPSVILESIASFRRGASTPQTRTRSPTNSSRTPNPKP